MNLQPTSNSARRRRRAGFVVALGVLALLPGVAAGQPQFLEPNPLGLHLFQNFLGGFKLQPLSTIDDLAAKKPGETVLVVFGDLTCLDDLANARQGGLQQFIDDGGAVLIASDRADGNRLAPLGLLFAGRKVIVPSAVKDRKVEDTGHVWLIPPGGNGIATQGLVSEIRQVWKQKEQTNYKNHSRPQEVRELEFDNGDRIILTANLWKKQQAELYPRLDEKFNDCIVVKGHIGSRHPIFAECDAGIVVDKPSFLDRAVGNGNLNEKKRIDILCSFPPFWNLQVNRRQFGGVIKDRHIVSEPGFAAASAGTPDSKERVVILSGHSLFLNCALAQRDLDNATFTINTIRWLTDSKRKYCLFVHDNKAVTKFDVPLLLPPIPTPRMINDFLRALEEENFFNRILVDNISKQRLLRVLLTLSLVGLAVYGFRRYGLARHRQDYNVPLVATKLAQVVADFLPPLVRRRHHALRGNDFLGAARAVARECFEGAHRGRQPSEPPVWVGPPRDRAALEHAVGRLWLLARGDDHPPVSADAFSQIALLADQVKAALARGTLRWKT
jgi:hypothetical protein